MSLMNIRSEWLKLKRGAAVVSSLPTFSVVVAATFTADPLEPYLGFELREDGAHPPAITIAPYNQVLQLCYDFKRAVGDQRPDAIAILWRVEDFARGDFQAFLRTGADEGVLAKVGELADAVAELQASYGGIIVAAAPPFPHSPDCHIRSLRNSVEAGALHRKIVDAWVERMSGLPNVSLLDLDGLQRFVGVQNALDWRKWYLFRQPFTETFWHEVAVDAAALIKSQRLSAKKCVVVDCDNTLWGGVVGEDGVGGIALSDDFPGSAFRDFQQQLLGLRSQGVMIALCSKNNEDDVWEVFDKHDGMALKRDHVVAHRINWNDKPTNIASIAEELNIGLDSCVFVDDSAMEIGQVRSALPTVTCFQVPEDVSAFPTAFAAYRGFDRLKITDEDRTRSEMMVDERRRRELAVKYDGDEFRKNLGLKIDVFEVMPEHVARVSQLINKTNQFNLTTLRKSASEVAALIADPAFKVVAWRVADRFGDYGLVGVAILEIGGEAADIETLLMSCRVLGRGVEEAVLAALADLTRRLGLRRLTGEYRRSAKNELVARLYPDHGFAEIAPNQWALTNMDALRWPAEIERVGL